MNLQIGVAGGVNLDSAGKRKQVIEVEKLGERLVNPTFFEIEGWKRMKFFPKTLEIFGFDPDSAKITLEKVDLPISIGNELIYNAMNWTYHPHNKTFLVRKRNSYFNHLKIKLQDALHAGNVIVTVLSNLHDNAAHAVLIYSLDNDKFKVKDSYGRKYEIPMNRPDSLQVKIRFEIFKLLSF